MGTYVFWLLIIALAAALVISGVSRDIAHRKKFISRIKEEFGSCEDTCHGTDAFRETPALFGYMTGKYPDSFVIDDITVSDLSLRDIYSRMNRCVTSPGEEFLYCRMRQLPAGEGGLYEDIAGYAKDPDRACAIIYILATQIGKSADAFRQIMALSVASAGSITTDLVMLFFLAAAIVMIAIAPVWGLVLTLVMLVICIWGYFRERALMDDNLKGFSYALRLIRGARHLEGECADIAKYSPLYGLLRGAFLIPMRDMTSSNPLTILLDYMRMITHIDIIVYKLKLWKLQKNIGLVEELYCDIGKLDCLLAMASYIKNRKHCRAEVTDEYRIKAGQIYHPLVQNPVYNDFEATRGMIITGSNASGKSTFLKAVAVSVLFAGSLGFAFADSFRTGRYRIYTSMALADNLLGNESYYVVEARSIKRMCDVAAADCLFIIDEVLKGTNTVERIAAGANILRALCESSAMCFAATHDLELAYLLDDAMDKYHFTEEIHENRVEFPFLIKKGVSESTNAIRLLAMLGFDDGIVDAAGELAEKYNKTGSWSMQ